MSSHSFPTRRSSDLGAVEDEHLFAAARAAGLRLVTYSRPGYGHSTPRGGPDHVITPVLADADDTAALLDHLGIGEFVTLGWSGGGPRALACAASAPSRVLAAIVVSSPAPPDADGLDRYRGMAPGIQREQRAVVAGRAALDAVLAADEWDETAFTAGDLAALEGEWGWFGGVVAAANASGPDATADDLLAAGRAWGFDLGAVAVPVLVVHGAADRMVPLQHGEWLAAHVTASEVAVVPDAGHIAVLVQGPPLVPALRRLAASVRS